MTAEDHLETVRRHAAETRAMIPLAILDRLTDAEADNLRTAQRQGDLPGDLTLTWAVVLDSWLQMPEEVQVRLTPPDQMVSDVDRALLQVIARYGLEGDVIEAYQATHGWKAKPDSDEAHSSAILAFREAVKVALAAGSCSDELVPIIDALDAADDRGERLSGSS